MVSRPTPRGSNSVPEPICWDPAFPENSTSFDHLLSSHFRRKIQVCFVQEQLGLSTCQQISVVVWPLSDLLGNPELNFVLVPGYCSIAKGYCWRECSPGNFCVDGTATESSLCFYFAQSNKPPEHGITSLSYR